jgi:carbon monoxide dehydrogenase subunit G
MKFENGFVVRAPIDDVWATLMDVERVAPCMPGAEVLDRIGDDTYKVGVKVKVGPISMLYRGQVEIVERDDTTRQATMRAKAKEARGQGTADAQIHMSLIDQPDGTHATIETQVQLRGKAAAMGQGVIVDVAEKLVETFAANLAEMLVAAPGGGVSAPAGGSAPEPAAGLADAATATAEAPVAAAQTTPRPAAPGEPAPPRRAAPAQDSLPVGKIAASVIAGRLSNPRTLLIATATLALVFGAIGYAIGKAR